MALEKTLTVSVGRHMSASPEQAFDAWLEPAMVVQWFAPTLGAMTRVDIDARPGGAFYLDQRRGDTIARHWGQYLELSRPQQLVFTWCVEGADSEDTVTVDITPTELGCRVTVSHTMSIAYEAYKELTRHGWTVMLESMALALEEAERRSRQLVLKQRLLARVDQVFAAWTDTSLARQWLFSAADDESSHYAFDVRPGGRWTITGRRGGTSYTVTGEYTVVEPPRRLEFTVGMPQFSPNADQVSVLCEPDGNGCSMTLIQKGTDIARELSQLPRGELGASGSGWQDMFNSLAGVLARGQQHATLISPTTMRFERLLPGSVEDLWYWLTVSDKRGQWLATGEMPSTVGEEFVIRFDHARLSPDDAPTPERFKPYEGGVDSRHRLTRYQPSHILGMSWGGGGEPESEVIFELVQEGGQTRLALTHTGLQSGDMMFGTAGGWHTHLAVLESKLAGITPPSFWTLFDGIENEYRRRWSDR